MQNSTPGQGKLDQFFKIISLVFVIVSVASFGQAAYAKSKDQTPKTSPTTTQSADIKTVAALEGFRSAKFGMSEKEIRAVILKDFNKSKKQTIRNKNRTERTRSLTISVPDVLSEGGTAKVSYVFGYKTKKLIQIGVSWSKASDAKMTEEMLYSNGEILRNHFQAAGYNPKSIKAGIALDTGLLMFQGSDASSRSVVLLLQGKYKKDGKGKRVLNPNMLVLLYVSSLDKPDVFRIKSGKF